MSLASLRSCVFVLFASLMVGAASAQTYTVTRCDDTAATSLQTGAGYGPGAAGDLRYEMFAAMAAGGTATINFACGTSPQKVTLSQPLPPIFEATANTGATAPASFNLTIDGGTAGSVVIDGTNQFRVFWVDNVAVALKNLVIQNALGKGGNGAPSWAPNSGGGGGGAGFGGGLFVNQSTANVTVSNVSFVSERAIGGNGGGTSSSPGVAAGSGGGGGLGYDGAVVAGDAYAGGGGGVAGAATPGTSSNSFSAGGAGGGGVDRGASPGVAYAANSAGGVGSSSTGAGGKGGFGGGGSGGDVYVNSSDQNLYPGPGGAGGFGGGGGGASSSYVDSAIGELGGVGGAGGFGGGGGGAGYCGMTGAAGGAVAVAVASVQGGVGGGCPGSYSGEAGAGGGGAAAGAAIFVAYGSLTISRSTGSGITATAGAGGIAYGGINGSAGTADATPVFNYAGTVNGSTTVGPIYGALTVGQAVGTTSIPQTATATFASAVAANTAWTVNVLTQGVANQDFVQVIGGTCGTGSGNAGYAVNASCTVQFTFAPKAPGTRLGAVTLTSGATTYATSYISGIGLGPQVAFVPGTISTIAGYGSSATSNVSISTPQSLVVDAAGNVYFADPGRGTVDMISATTGVINQVGTAAVEGGFVSPVALDGAGNLYYIGTDTTSITRKNLLTGSLTTLAEGQVNNPLGLFADGAGNLYIADTNNNKVLMLSPAGVMTTVAGTGGQGNYSGDGGPATSATLNHPQSVAVDGAGNVFIADANNDAIREVSGGTIQTIVGNYAYAPASLTLDPAGNVYFADLDHFQVQKWNAGTGTVTAVAGVYGGGQPPSGDGGPATSAKFNDPAGVALDGAGNLYVSDNGGGNIRKVTASAANVVFPTTAVGQVSAAQSVRVSNIGNAPLLFPAPNTGQNPSVAGGFSFVNTSNCPLAYGSSGTGSLATGADCTDNLTYNPTMTGTTSGYLVMTDNNLNVTGSTQQIHMGGSTYTTPTMTMQVIGQTVPAGSATLQLEFIVGYGAAGVPTGTPVLTVDHRSTGVGAMSCTAKAAHTTCFVSFNEAVLNVADHEIEVTQPSDSTYTNAVTGTARLNITGTTNTMSGISKAPVSAASAPVVAPAAAVTALPSMAPRVAASVVTPEVVIPVMAPLAAAPASTDDVDGCKGGVDAKASAKCVVKLK